MSLDRPNVSTPTGHGDSTPADCNLFPSDPATAHPNASADSTASVGSTPNADRSTMPHKVAVDPLLAKDDRTQEAGAQNAGAQNAVMKNASATVPSSIPMMSGWQIFNMNVGFLGIQFAWGLQMANMSAIFEHLGARAHQIPLLWLAAPITGLIIQPVIGNLSDYTWTPLGKRRPYFLLGAALSAVALVLMPNCKSLGMAVVLLWLLDLVIGSCSCLRLSLHRSGWLSNTWYPFSCNFTHQVFHHTFVHDSIVFDKRSN